MEGSRVKVSNGTDFGFLFYETVSFLKFYHVCMLDMTYTLPYRDSGSKTYIAAPPFGKGTLA